MSFFFPRRLLKNQNSSFFKQKIHAQKVFVVKKKQDLQNKLSPMLKKTTNNMCWFGEGNQGPKKMCFLLWGNLKKCWRKNNGVNHNKVWAKSGKKKHLVLKTKSIVFYLSSPSVGVLRRKCLFAVFCLNKKKRRNYFDENVCFLRMTFGWDSWPLAPFY